MSGEWIPWTPARANHDGGTVAGEYKRAEGDVICRIRVTGGRITGTPSFSLPSEAEGAPAFAMGDATYEDEDGYSYPGMVRLTPTAATPWFRSGALATYFPVDAMSPFEWTSDDVLFMAFRYREAA